jgi:hypothetical protein
MWGILNNFEVFDIFRESMSLLKITRLFEDNFREMEAF